MQSKNWYKSNVLDEKSSEVVQRDLLGMISNLGATIGYEVWNDNLEMFSQPIYIKAYITSLTDEENSGSIDISDEGILLIATKSFYDNNIVPSDKDRITIGNEIYGILVNGLSFYGRDEIQSDNINNSMIVSIKFYNKNNVRIGNDLS